MSCLKRVVRLSPRIVPLIIANDNEVIGLQEIYSLSTLQMSMFFSSFIFRFPFRLSLSA